MKEDSGRDDRRYPNMPDPRRGGGSSRPQPKRDKRKTRTPSRVISRAKLNSRKPEFNHRQSDEEVIEGQTPWWLRDLEKYNLDVIGEYKPWWASDTDWSGMTVNELKDELKKNGLKVSGNKEELIARLEKTKALYSLTDENFVPAEIYENDDSPLPPIFPEVYERQ
eukprot:CAMPEP_0113944240 /NCGR_PEP_ID=MMETSP1339-20121228/31983_1 /TAXON_ID=94617 /ORGANISM="Fibrocapsa japonica" /LENGTH=165 /DNA_ID=CAMNT_0000949369 /DNA_START=195 /DNA_END=692 /DNA_ORIENTATION=- /assembly_acc=CAM_ASM_000762